MRESELADLFVRTADALPVPAAVDPYEVAVGVRRKHRRRRVRRAGLLTVVTIACIAQAVGQLTRTDTAKVDMHTGPSLPAASGKWVRLPDPPLSPRTGATSAWNGKEIVVVGGWTFLCPPNADCSLPNDAPFSDGAAFDPATGTWRQIAPAPVGFEGARGAVVDGDLYVLTPCHPGHRTSADKDPSHRCPMSDEHLAFLEYDADTDTWTSLPPPPNGLHYQLTAAGPNLVAYTSSDEHEEVADMWFDVKASTWREIPDDPLPPVFDRRVVPSDDGSTLFLFAASIERAGEPTEEKNLAARLDLSSGRWTALPNSPSRGYRAWGVDDVIVLEPHFGGTGGIFDPADETWSTLPSPPGERGRQHIVAGALGPRDSVYEDAAGSILDVAARQWITVPAVDERDIYPQSSVTAVGRDLFVFGGALWNGSRGRLLGDAWMWTAPVSGG